MSVAGVFQKRKNMFLLLGAARGGDGGHWAADGATFAIEARRSALEPPGTKASVQAGADMGGLCMSNYWN